MTRLPSSRGSPRPWSEPGDDPLMIASRPATKPAATRILAPHHPRFNTLSSSPEQCSAIHLDWSPRPTAWIRHLPRLSKSQRRFESNPRDRRRKEHHQDHLKLRLIR